MKYTAKFQRRRGGIDGYFTLLSDGKPIPEFNRMPARSGQAGHADNQWERGKGAIPSGNHLLWLKDPVDPGPDFPVAPGGLGKCYRISNQPDNHDVIKGTGGNVRTLIRLHPENAYNGSAGCIVLVWNKGGGLVAVPALKLQVVRLFSLLDTLSKGGVAMIPLLCEQ